MRSSESGNTPVAAQCPRCGAPVDCGYRAGRDTCWCAKYPPNLAVPADPSARCYCEDCLKALLAERERAPG